MGRKQTFGLRQEWVENGHCLKSPALKLNLRTRLKEGPKWLLLPVRRSDGETLNVLGMPLRFLCDAHDTAGAWSLMEEEIPHRSWARRRTGTTGTRHNYVHLAARSTSRWTARPSRIEAGDFAYLPRNTVHAFKGGFKDAHQSAQSSPRRLIRLLSLKDVNRGGSVGSR